MDFRQKFEICKSFKLLDQIFCMNQANKIYWDYLQQKPSRSSIYFEYRVLSMCVSLSWLPVQTGVSDYVWFR